MAIMIPEICEMRCNGKVTNGERKVFNLLKNNLSDKYTVYYNTCVNGLHPDFIIVGKDIGIIVLEIKDYKITTIVEPPKGDGNLTILANITDKYGNIVKDENGNIEKKRIEINPYDQARTYANSIKNHINTNFPFNYNSIVVFSELYEEDLRNSYIGYDKCMNPKITIYKESLEEIENKKLDLEEIIKAKRIKDGYIMDEKQLKELNEWIYPLSKPNLEKLEENINKRIEEELTDLKWGQYILQGVSGSGKTIYLTTLAKIRLNLIERYGFSEKILITAYNKTLTAYFKKYFEDYKNIDIKTKYELLNQRDNSNKYDFILIDEGQDFTFEELDFIIKTYLNKQIKEDYIIAMDGAQNIYRNENFILSNLSKNIVIKELKENYRNNNSIFEYANTFLNCNSSMKIEKYKVGQSNYIIDDFKSLKKDTKSIELKKYNNFDDEMQIIKKEIQFYTNRGFNKKDICIMYVGSKKKDGGYLNKDIQKALKEEKINYYDFFDNKHSFQADLLNDNVNISTIHSSKGFEYKLVILCGLEEQYFIDDNDLKKLIYTGMTRAKERLIILIGENNDITKLLEKTYNFIYGKEQVQCINCKKSIDKFDKYCYSCGESYLFDINISKYLKCEKCNTHNVLDKIYCSKCSNKL